MLTLSRQQIRQLETIRAQSFARLALAHAREHFGDRFSEFGDEPCQALLQHALNEAARHGFDSRPDVLKHVNLIFEFGPDFGRAGHFDWADDILTDALPDRMQRLYAEAMSRSPGQPD